MIVAQSLEQTESSLNLWMGIIIIGAIGVVLKAIASMLPPAMPEMIAIILLALVPDNCQLVSGTWCNTLGSGRQMSQQIYDASANYQVDGHDAKYRNQASQDLTPDVCSKPTRY